MLKIQRTVPVLLLLFVVLLAAPLCTGASVLAGDTVGLTYDFPTVSTVYNNLGTVTVPGGFTSIVDGFVNVDVNDANIVVTVPTIGFSAGDFNGFVLTDYSNSPITSVSIDPASTLSGFTAAGLSWTSNQIFVNWEGISFDPGVLTLDISGGGGSVPEPATWLLLGSSLVGLAAWRKRRC